MYVTIIRPCQQLTLALCGRGMLCAGDLILRYHYRLERLPPAFLRAKLSVMILRTTRIAPHPRRSKPTTCNVSFFLTTRLLEWCYLMATSIQLPRYSERHNGNRCRRLRQSHQMKMIVVQNWLRCLVNGSRDSLTTR